MIEQPCLFIAGKKDFVLKPEMSHGMERFIPELRKGEVDSGHWALTQKPAEVNKFIQQWLEEVVFEVKKSSL